MLFEVLSILVGQYVVNPSISYGTVVDGRDGQSYRTIMVGNRKWMAENLNYSVKDSWCLNKDSCDMYYGRFYNFGAAQSVCMEGWHLPTRDEFDSLGIAAGGPLLAGVTLKATRGFPEFHGLNGNGVDGLGWFGLPTGRRDPFGNMLSSVTQNGGNAYYWTSEGVGDLGYRYLIGHGVQDFTGATDPKGNGFSVRCINDTVFKHDGKRLDTVWVLDTIIKIQVIERLDTLRDTVIIDKVKEYRDTVIIDKVKEYRDTVWQIKEIIKTETRTDTVNTAMCSESRDFSYREELVSNKSLGGGGVELGSFRKDGMVVLKIESAARALVQVYVYDNLGVYVNDGKFRIETGISYITFGNLDSQGRTVPDGVYTLRSISNRDGIVTNNVYLIGVDSN